MRYCFGSKSKAYISVGTHRLQKTNEKGIEDIDLLRSLNLIAALTFYDHKHKITCKIFDGNNTAYQLDKWMVNLLYHIKDTYIIDYGVYSDHSTINTDLKLKKV